MPPAGLIVSPSVKRSLHAAGSVLALAGILFVGMHLHEYWMKIDLPRMTLAGWSAIACLALGYGAANCLLALAWWHLLKHRGVTVSRLRTIRLYGISNLAKYVPGNVVHLAGRQAMGMAAGISARVLARSMIWELGLITLAGTLFCWIMLPRWLPGLPVQAGLSLCVFSVALLASGLGKFAGRHVMAAFLWQVLFLFISGVIFVGLIAILHDNTSVPADHWLPIVGAYVAAWLAGMVTPGAPAGAGVREMLLLFFLKNIISEENLIVAILLGRLVTVAGDLVFFVISLSISPLSSLSSKKYAQQTNLE